MPLRGLFKWTNPTAKISTASLSFGYRFIIRYKIPSGLEFDFQAEGYH